MYYGMICHWIVWPIDVCSWLKPDRIPAIAQEGMPHRPVVGIRRKHHSVSAVSVTSRRCARPRSIRNEMDVCDGF